MDTQRRDESRGPLLVAFGNPLLDITAVVKDRSLHHQYQLPVDGQLEVNDTQRAVFNHVMNKYPVEYTAGGCALNSSRVFCWVLGEPHRVVFVGGIGKDSQAQRLSSIVEESGVVSRFVVVDDQPTGTCVALVLGACRCLCADIGAASTCEPHHVFTPALTPVLEAAQYIYVEGYFITHSFPATLQIAQYAAKHGKTLVFNLCGSYVCENHPNELSQLLPYVDILFGFVEEYRTLDRFVDVSKMAATLTSFPENIAHDLALVLKAIRGEGKVIKDGIKDGVKSDLSDNDVIGCPDLQQTDSVKCSNGVNHSERKCLQDEDGMEDKQRVNGVNCSQEGLGDTNNLQSLRISEEVSRSQRNCDLSNRTETTNLSNGTSKTHRSDPKDSLPPNNSSNRKQKLVVVTKGPSPLWYSLNRVVRERQVPPITPEEIVDTTGAGDSFVGGFLAALSSGQPLDKCLDCGVWTAQQLLRQKGCTLPSYAASFLHKD
ncbi:hypothetical protein Pcinc_026395 [Petrolisthes cinctipes]|uniref:adenosine kinase n=1 Tax=Petrolisthes cinctipes TaxID=88211 RepID=A0AAE1F6Q5_PETCI|nr:hypothetical protein Pcinc_026395 [Petrolisthes cinctipes]